MNYRPKTTDVRVSLPSNSVLHLGDFGVGFLFVCFYTLKKMVDFLYFCIVSHFVFTGKFSGVFFQSCAVSFEAVWVPVPREKRQLLPLPPLGTPHGDHRAPRVPSEVPLHVPPGAALTPPRDTRSLFALTAQTSLFQYRFATRLHCALSFPALFLI